MKEIGEYFKIWSEKMSIPIIEIEKEFGILLEDEKKIHPNTSLEQQTQRALQRLALQYKKQMRTPAVGFEGIIIGLGDSKDIVEKQKREANELFRIDPMQAIATGVTNENGIPLDIRKEWANGKTNAGYGKPLPEHNYLRTIYGIAVKLRDEKVQPKFFVMNLSGEKAIDDNIPLFKPVRFMAIDRTTEDLVDEKFILNASTYTKFDISDISLPKYDELIEKFSKNLIVDIKDLMDYHMKEKDDFNRIAIVKGDVSVLNLEPTPFGSRILHLEDLSNIENLENKGVTCWVPERINIDFGEGSKVYVIGRTSQGKIKDEHGNLTEELGDVSINVYGILAIPDFKVELPNEIVEITKENLPNLSA
jgi:hypothetical protein